MYAIFQHGGHQYRVAPGDRLVVNRLASEIGDIVALEPVLFLAVAADGKPGSIETKGARVAATVISHHRGPKIRVFKYKAKKRYRRTLGYRSDLTELRIDAVLASGDALPKRAAAHHSKADTPAVKPAATSQATSKDD